VRERIGSGRRAPRARSVDLRPHHPPRAGISAVGDAFRSRPARTSQAPSLGFLKDRPSVDTPAGVHSHELAPASAGRLPTPCMFRPRRSSRPRRLPPPTGSRACCVPHPTLRFIGLPRPSDACLRPPPRFPTDACPPELFPSEKRRSRHREAMPPCRSSATPTRLRGLHPLGNPSRRRFVAEPHRPMLSWASPLGAPLERDTLRHVRERTALRGARDPPRRTDRVASPQADATGARRPPPRPPCGGGRSGRHHCRAAMPVDHDRLRRHRSGVLAGLCPRETTVVVPGQACGAPQARRKLASTTRPRARVPQQHPRCPRSLAPRGDDHRGDRSALLSRVP